MLKRHLYAPQEPLRNEILALIKRVKGEEDVEPEKAKLIAEAETISDVPSAPSGLPKRMI